jgi:hypothetical protein
MSALLPHDDLDDLKERAYNDLSDADKHAALAVVYAARAGGRFLLMRHLVERATGYGSWGPWVEANVRLSSRSVQFYMQLAKTLPTLADPDTDIEAALGSDPAVRELAGMSLRKAMKALAEPKTLPALTDRPSGPLKDEPNDGQVDDVEAAEPEAPRPSYTATCPTCGHEHTFNSPQARAATARGWRGWKAPRRAR